MKVIVLLSGCGVYDGSEIHESVLTLLALSENNITYQCVAPNIDQHHVIDHTTGSEMNETRNVLVESARIARGEIVSMNDVKLKEFDALVIPGGFGAAKNLSKWAFSGPEGDIDPSVKAMITEAVDQHMPIVALCMGPTLVAKALENHSLKSILTVGSAKADSPYDIAAISSGMSSLGAKVEEKCIDEIAFDSELQIISAPCYMMEGSILDVRNNIKQAIDRLVEISNK